jgi:hypothetical protein
MRGSTEFSVPQDVAQKKYIVIEDTKLTPKRGCDDLYQRLWDDFEK